MTLRRAWPLALLLGAGCGGPGGHRNPHPIHLVRPADAPLSAAARLGRELFFDPALSGSGTMACATCHDPAHAYASPEQGATHAGGLNGEQPGVRAVPSLRYLYRVPAFGIGPEVGEQDRPGGAPVARTSATPAAKRAGATPVVPPMVPRGGLFWDGRVSRLVDQALVPLLNPAEMANRGIGSIAARLRAPPYATQLRRLYGDGVFDDTTRLVDEAMSAVSRFEIEDSSFHPFSSKYDAYLEGKATLTDAEWRGLQAFDDPARGNCAACHLDRPGPDGSPPLFTDYEYEALGVPRNDRIAANRVPTYYDLGLCGPVRADLAGHPEYCGLFRTPSLRNAATRQAFFHNGVYDSLARVLRFYNERAVDPAAVYPRNAAGRVQLFDDLPPRYRANIDTEDAPFNRAVGAARPMTEAEMSDIIAFLRTLTDGWTAPSAKQGGPR